MKDNGVPASCKPLFVGAVDVTALDVCRIIEGLANVPGAFKASDLVRYVPGDYEFSQEVLNRLFQRWRKLHLIRFRYGRWSLARGAQDKLQSDVSRTRASVAQPESSS